MNITDIQSYLAQMTKEFKGKRADKKAFRSDLEDAVACFFDDHPEATLDDIYKHFGTPEDLKTENRELDIVKKKAKPLRMWHFAILGVCAVLVISALYLLNKEYDEYDNANNSYDIESLHIGNYKETDPPGQTPIEIYIDDIK